MSDERPYLVNRDGFAGALKLSADLDGLKHAVHDNLQVRRHQVLLAILSYIGFKVQQPSDLSPDYTYENFVEPLMETLKRRVGSYGRRNASNDNRVFTGVP